MAPKACCICSRSARKSPASFRKSLSYESDFECCFGPASENRSGWLCPACKAAVATHYRNNRTKTFHDLLDSKGKVGYQGQARHRFRNKEIDPILTPVCLNKISSPTQTTTSTTTSTSTTTTRLTSTAQDVHDRESYTTYTTDLNNMSHSFDKPVHVCETPTAKLKSSHKKRRLVPESTIDQIATIKKVRKKVDNYAATVETTEFLNRQLPNRVVKRILWLCDKEDIVNLMACTLCQHTEPKLLIDAISVKYDNIKSERDRLKRRTDIPLSGPLTQQQKELLSQLVRNRQNNVDKDGLLIINHPRGKPTKLLEVPNTQTSSSKAAEGTKARRAKIIERLTKILAQVSDNSASVLIPGDKDIHTQVVSVIKRNKSAYADAAQEAGLNIVGRFNKETVLALRSIMTHSMWRLIRKTLKTEVGHDVFMTEKKLKEEIHEMEYEYECGTFTNPSGDETSFVRVVNVEVVITKMVNELRDAGLLGQLQNVTDDVLWLHVSADKGGKSTKLILQLINVNDKGRHSIKNCKILGFFEGKDSRQNLEEIFGPTLSKLQELCSNITDLRLTRPKPESTSALQRKPAPDDLNFVPLKPLDESNTSVSLECPHCKKAMGDKTQRRKVREAIKVYSQNQQNQRLKHCPPSAGPGGTPVPSSHCFNNPSASNHVGSCETSSPNDGQIFTTGKLTVEGDWMWLAALIGTSGPNGKYFCNTCLVVTTDMPKGRPHAASILPKYQHKTQGRSRVLPDDKDFERTFDGCSIENAKFVASGQNKSNAQKFQNCINAPLLTGPEPNIEIVSVSPLHISLGLGLQVLNIVENTAITLDKEIKDTKGEYASFHPVFNHQKEILKKCQTLNKKVDTIKDKITEIKKRKVDIIKARANFFKKKKNGAFVYNSDLAVGVRRDYDSLCKGIKDHEQEIEKTKKTLKTREKELNKTLEELNKIKGPFKTKFDDVLRGLSLKRAAYHSGSLIGPDVKKVASYSNTKKFADIFKVIEIVTPDGPQKFSSNMLRQKIRTLLTKFSQCYEMYNKNRTLCAHEVETLAMRCSSFGCWFPVNFPDENLKRKFHNLTVEVPKQARRLRTIGMLTEQTIESIHPYVNKLDRMFCTVQNVTSKSKLICRQHNIFSTPTLPQL